MVDGGDGPAPAPFPTTAPSERIMLRHWGRGAGDAAALVAAWNDPEIVRWTDVPEDRSPAAALRWVTDDARNATAGPTVDLVIARRDEPDAVLGEVGLVLLDRSRGWAEIGFWVAAGSRGRGVATTAVRLLLDGAAEALGITKVMARVRPGNVASDGVLERNGFEAVGALDDGTRAWVFAAAQPGVPRQAGSEPAS